METNMDTYMDTDLGVDADMDTDKKAYIYVLKSIAERLKLSLVRQ